jgi:hypothetical protein
MIKLFYKILFIIITFVLTLVVLSTFHFKPKYIEVKINAEYLANDRFQLFYKYENDSTFVESRSINKRFTGEDGFQNIDFKIPLNNKFLKNIRLDISSANYNQKPILINYIKISNGLSEITYNDVSSEFTFNNYLIYEGGKFKTRVLNGKYDPQIILKDHQKIEELSHSKKKYNILERVLFSLLISCLICLIVFYALRKPILIFNSTFIIILFLPIFINQIKVKEKAKSLDNKKISSLPEIEFTKTYFRNIESFYNDNFPFKNTLIKSQTLFKNFLFSSSSSPDKVRFGKDGFIFLNNTEVQQSYTKQNLLNAKSLDSISNKFYHRKLSLKRDSVDYFIGYFPNKHTIYKEKLPSSMQSQILDTITLATQLKKELEKLSITFFDPTKELLNNKNEHLLYHKLDTHWNDYGAFLTYKYFFNHNKGLNITPYNISDFNIVNRERYWGDLTKLIGTDTLPSYKEDYRPLFVFKNKQKYFEYQKTNGLPPRTIKTGNVNVNNDLTAIFFGDSYSIYLRQFFSLHFREIYYIRDSYNQDIIDKIKPDIIFEFSVERFISKHL